MFVIAFVTTAGAALIQNTRPVQQLGNVFYDWFYKRRSIEDQTAGSVVIVAVDQKSLDDINNLYKRGWPWPRDMWPPLIQYLEKSGARCVAFDLLFTERSSYASELPDDAAFAEALDSAAIPVVLAQTHDATGKPNHFFPPVKKPPKFAAVDLESSPLIREYRPVEFGEASLALAVAQLVSAKIPVWGDQPFRLHYYGPYRDKNGIYTIRDFPASSVMAAAIDPVHDHDIKPEDFAGKIVLIGPVTPGTYDLKSSPLSEIYPGVEVHATAIENLLFQQRVHPVGGVITLIAAALVSLAGAAGGLFPRGTMLKLIVGLGVVTFLVLLSMGLFLHPKIYWLDPTAPLLAAVLSIILSLGWSYFVEDKQSRFFLRTLGQCVSHTVAEQLRQDPSALGISTMKRELTILFSDIAGFTDLSELLQEKIGPLLNFYLDEMSAPIIATDGMVDKYIGDAIMSFWNAPLPQADHAERGCRSALAMRNRLAEIQPQLAELGGPGLAARIGISTGLVTFGWMGSSYKFNYSVIGDSANFASRLEGANKLYGSGILIGDSTAQQVKDKFVLRKIDLLRVKGKLRPAAVYQLLAEGQPDEDQKVLIDRYQTAFEHYRTQDWENAERILLELLAKFPDDGPGQALLHRVHAFRREPPESNWDGVYVAKEK